MTDSQSVPENIVCKDQVFDIAFHPRSQFLAAGLINGSIELWSYASEGQANQLLLNINSLASSCRGLRFSEGGSSLYFISSDKSLRGVDGNGNQIFHYAKAHDAPLNRICCLAENTLVTGDDMGEVKLWDLRLEATVKKWHVHEDFISGFAYHADTTTLISVSGDSTLCMYDLRGGHHSNGSSSSGGGVGGGYAGSDSINGGVGTNSSAHRSDQAESELTSVLIVHGGAALLTGTQDGSLGFYQPEDCSELSGRFTGHPEAVECLWKIDEGTVLTGCSDGLIRVVSLHPNKILGVIGDHEDFPVEGLCASRDGNLLGSFAHDEVVRLWDVSGCVGASEYELVSMYGTTSRGGGRGGGGDGAFSSL
jgi:WD repeat-containing protein 55